jgi:uncharacterized phage infection (PIP) family protein YhgE
MQGETGTTSESKGGIGETLSHVADQAREQGSNLASQAGERVRGLVGQQIASGADLVGEIARAAHNLAGQLEKSTPQIARMMHSAAESAESFSGDMRDKSLDELMELTSDFARKQPALFIGAAMTAGFVLARFVKASASDSSGMGASSRNSQSGSRPSSSSRQSPGYPSRSTSTSQFHDA